MDDAKEIDGSAEASGWPQEAIGEAGAEVGPSQGPGDSGGDLTLPEGAKATTTDTRLAARALRQRWPITPELRAKLIEGLAEMATDPNASRRQRIAAIRELMRADKLNLDETLQPRGDAPGVAAVPVAPPVTVGVGVNLTLAERSQVDKLDLSELTDAEIAILEKIGVST